MIRPAAASDAAWIARVHVAAWHEACPGLVPAAEIAAMGRAARRARWEAILAAGRSGAWVAQGRGLGRALMEAARRPVPTTARVIEGNPACDFYEATGARLLGARDERIGASPIREHVYGWSDPTGRTRPGSPVAPSSAARSHPPRSAAAA